MTPRAYWDRHGGLLEENPSDPTQVRYVWNGDSDRCRPTGSGGTYGSRWIAEQIHGPLVAVA